MVPLIEIIEELRVGPRTSGTPACDEAALGLAKRFEEIGYRPEVQDYTFIGWQVPEPPVVTNLTTGHELESRAVTWCGGTAGIVAEGAVAQRGKFNSWGLGTTREYPRWAIVENGVDRRDVYLIGGLGAHCVLPYPMQDVAYILVSQAELQKLADAGENVRVSIRTKLGFGARGLNVLATKQGRSTHEILIVAHHDTVYDADNGIHDNGGGCVTLLLLADILREIDTYHTVRFLSTGGEELNLVGARSYIRRREEEDTLDRVRSTITLDYITQAPHQIFVRCTPDFIPIISKVTSENRGAEYAYELEDGMYSDLGCIDGQAFAEKGISSIYYAPTGASGELDDDSNSIAQNLQINARFVRDLLMEADSVMRLEGQ